MTRQIKRTAGVSRDVKARNAVPQNRKPKTAKPRLTDRKLVVLSAAAQRDDRVVALPETLKGRARDAFAAALLKHGLVAAIRARRGQIVWRRDQARSQDIALVVTDAGLAGIGIEEQAKDQAAAPDRGKPAITKKSGDGDKAPRSASKKARLVAMLSADGGCTVAAAAEALGWLPHTTRAALTGLRRKGYAIERVKGVDGEGSRHRIVASSVAA